MNKHPHSNLGKFLHPKGGVKMAVAAQKTPTPAKSQVSKTTQPKGAQHKAGPKMKPWS